MAEAPGVTVTSRELPAGSSYVSDTGQAFMCGPALRGSVDGPITVRNLDQLVEETGDRDTGSLVYDSADAAFREGANVIHYSRVVGPGAAVATVNAPAAGPTASLRIDAANPGSWGADVDVVFDGLGNPIQVLLGGDVVEESPAIEDKAAAIAWANGVGALEPSLYIRLADIGAGLFPEDGTYSLVGGDDDRDNATDDEWADALDRFPKELGPGQVSFPGRTTATAHGQLLDHAAARNRYAYLDLPDTATAATLIAAKEAVETHDNARYGAAFGRWAVYPGLVGGSAGRSVPPSAYLQGLTARSDGSGNHANTAIAGENGILVGAIGFTQPEPTESDRASLNEAGVNMAITKGGTFRNYGFRSLVNAVTQPAFLQASAGREFMSLGARGDVLLEAIVFGNVDGKGAFLAKAAGMLRGMCLGDFDAGALYGDLPDEAFKVDVGPDVNPTEQLAQGIIKAVIAAKVSPFAEKVRLELVKVPNTEALI